ncbi:uncharacterized protein BO72DRAFT_243251 [Aspergillus fijiensis CBS 313.89]|uniref:Uncharacterized protein n=1 Tax=Aspergillus fijiensis CBS 313.89 TaxID=1448319 RepID=A0A8G1RIM5_9EURO|nr:uncharacterized protein BO72DRAFT_243251 [Aspergillus fijiensis CBS 313.89]RAK73393.1 hypothetical protein BO72DRAFT_243251 [Aspergillus fijiensis CBS 313.89]
MKGSYLFLFLYSVVYHTIFMTSTFHIVFAKHANLPSPSAEHRNFQLYTSPPSPPPKTSHHPSNFSASEKQYALAITLLRTLDP